MNHPQLIEFLKRQVSLCQHLPDGRLRELADGSLTVSFEAHEAVAHQGDEANASNVQTGAQGFIQ